MNKIILLLFFLNYVVLSQSLVDKIAEYHQKTVDYKEKQDKIIQSEGKEAALRIYTSLWLNEPNNPVYYYLLSRLTGVNESIKLNEQALSIFPGYTWAYLMRGVCQELKKEPHAAEYYLKAVELKDDFFEAHENLGRIYFENKKYTDALYHIEKMLEINPRYGAAWVTKGNILFLRKNFKAAAECYQNAGIYDKTVDHWWYEAQCDFETGNYESALKNYEQSKKWFHNTRALLASAQCLYHMKRYDDSIAAYLRYHELAGETALSLRETGKAYMTLENYQQADFYLGQSLRQDPFSSATHFLLGLLYMRTREYNLAEYHLKSTCVLDKNNEIAAMKLNIVQKILSEQKNSQ